MSIFLSDFDVNQQDIGRVFTPTKWSKWCCETFGVYEAWRSGATIFDPTCGDGSFFYALFSIAQERGDFIKKNDLRNLFGVEISHIDKSHFINRVKLKFGLDFPSENYVTGDFLDYEGNQKYDFAVGNPPWINFTDLPKLYKEKVKPYFRRYELVKNSKDVLLGGSRVDFASLIIKKCMRDHVVDSGKGAFFVPLSLFFNESSNQYFRPSNDALGDFSIDKIVEFENNLVFSHINTRNGIIAMTKGQAQSFPVPFEIMSASKTRVTKCRPIDRNGAWYEITKNNEDKPFQTITVEEWQKPRQGINPCGLHKVFVFTKEQGEKIEEDVCKFTNGFGEKVMLETQNIYPLVGSNIFGGKIKEQKYILCLHDERGKPLHGNDVRKQKRVWEYISKYKEPMTARKGILIQSLINKGFLWGLIGVGAYSHSTYKVIWEALGKKIFRAVVVEGNLQGNQSLHAFIPSNSKIDAERICREMNNKVPKYLDSFGMEGTCNWAQPGRIKRILNFKSEQIQTNLIL